MLILSSAKIQHVHWEYLKNLLKYIAIFALVGLRWTLCVWLKLDRLQG